MRRHLTCFALALTALLAGCSTDLGAPAIFDEPIALVPEFAESMASAVDGGGIGASRLPDHLKLTTEQKAAIAALHEAFRAATAADVAALRALEEEARAAAKAGKGREEVRAILARAEPIIRRLTEAFFKLQEDILQVYTPEQRAWIEANRPKYCGPEGPPKLTEEQVKQIRELQHAFMAVVKDDIALIRRVAEEARQAHQAGASHEEIRRILAQADEARERVSQAERRLHEAIEAILTPDQRAKRCIPAPIPGSGGGRKP